MKKRLLALALSVTMLLQAPMVTQAADTVFMVPEISATWEPPGTVYKSPALDSLAYQGSGGFVADIINRRGLAAALTDLNANVSAGDYSVSILGIYPEGEALTDEIMQMIAGAGWKRVEIYYPTFFIAGNPNCAGMTPVIAKTENAELTQLLTTAGYTNQVATIKVEGVTIANPNTILYEPEFSFLRGETCTMYKYIPDIQKFVAGPTVDADGYKQNFMGMENLSSADGEVNGTYVVVTAALPAELVITTAEIQPLRDQLKQEEESKKEEEDSTQADDLLGTEDTNENATIVTSEDEAVAWTFANGEVPENFTAEAKVEMQGEKEVKVDFTYSGKLPEGTKVTIQLPEDASVNKDGAKLYFYYYNPETQKREFVSEGTAKDGKVTFAINHCSEYIITTEKAVTDAVEKTPGLLPIIGVGVAGLVIVAIVTGIIVIKKKKA